MDYFRVREKWGGIREEEVEDILKNENRWPCC